MKKMNKLVLFAFGLVALAVTGLMFSSSGSCGERCVARHLLLAAYKSRIEVETALTQHAVVSEHDIHGLYVEAGHIGAVGNVLAINASNGIVVSLEPIQKGSDVKWRCFIYPKTMQDLFVDEKCLGK